MSQHYLFYPKASRQGRLLRIMGGLLLCGSLMLWPAHLPNGLLLVKWLLLLLLAIAVLRQWRTPPARPFQLGQDGEGVWLDTGLSFRVSARSRLMPGVVMMALEQGQRKSWLWQHQDSYQRADWRRLCRLLVAIQRGERMVGADSGKVSG
ncbi:hypothetical protein KUV89_15985 [Marinobacter hydrocarbonoclasticus]|nr:hypothetical protein [Marinobacter nauticus]